jgi:hypothetical protein
MPLSDLLATLSRQLNVPMQLSGFGTCILQYDIGQELTVASVDHDRAVLLYQHLRRISAGEDWLPRRCLELNAYGARTQGATLGVDPEGDWIVLAQRRPLDRLDAQELSDWIAAFMTVATTLQAELAQGPEAVAAEAGAPFAFEGIRV